MNKLERQRMQRLELKSKGLCSKCFKTPSEPNKSRCTECREKQLAYQRANQKLLTARQRLRRILHRQENTMSIFALKTFINKCIAEGISEDTLLNITHDRYLDLHIIFAKKR
jgi:hypothetical protein